MPTSPHTLERHCAPTNVHRERLRVLDDATAMEAAPTGQPDAGPQAASVFGNDAAEAQSRGGPLAWLTPGRFWWGYAITLASIILGVHLVGR